MQTDFASCASVRGDYCGASSAPLIGCSRLPDKSRSCARQHQLAFALALEQGTTLAAAYRDLLVLLHWFHPNRSFRRHPHTGELPDHVQKDATHSL
jgi:hypothetical protein